MPVTATEIIGMLNNGLIVLKKRVSGPSSYSAGGFQITVPEVCKIHAASISSLKYPDTDNVVYKLDISISGNTITVVVKHIDVTSSSSAAWSEVKDGTDLSGLELELLIIGG